MDKLLEGRWQHHRRVEVRRAVHSDAGVKTLWEVVLSVTYVSSVILTEESVKEQEQEQMRVGMVYGPVN